MSDNKDLIPKKKEKTKKIETRTRYRPAPTRKEEVAVTERAELKRKCREEKLRIIKERQEQIKQEKRRKLKDTKDVIQSTATIIISPSKEDKSEEMDATVSNTKKSDPDVQKPEEGLQTADNKVEASEVPKSNINILEISVLEVEPQIHLVDLPIIEPLQPEENPQIVAQASDAAFMEIEELKIDQASASDKIENIELPDLPETVKLDEAAPQNEPTPKEDGEKDAGTSKDKDPCKGVDLPDQWFIDSGFPLERVSQWKDIFRTSKPLNIDPTSKPGPSE